MKSGLGWEKKAGTHDTRSGRKKTSSASGRSGTRGQDGSLTGMPPLPPLAFPFSFSVPLDPNQASQIVHCDGGGVKVMMLGGEVMGVVMREVMTQSGAA